MKDIDLTGYHFLPITGFKGEIDGNGAKIKNLTMNRSIVSTGLFDQITSNVTVKNIVLENVNISSSSNNVGGIVGQLSSGVLTMQNCSVSGTISGVNYVGGLVGYQAGGTLNISLSYNEADVITTGSYHAGGITSYHRTGTIERCYNSGNISSTSTSAATCTGGLVGYLTGSLQNCYNTGIVSSKSTGSIGGAVGKKATDVIVSNVYSIGEIISTSANAGGLVGGTESSNVINSYWCTQTSKITISYGGTGYGILTMQNITTYDSWDFDTIWNIEEGSLPYLRDVINTDNIFLSNISHYDYEGSGTVTSPFIIYTEEDLDNIRNYPYASYILGNNITMTMHQTDKGWEPISGFKGLLDGAGYKIIDLYINRPDEENVGLLGEITSSVTINNLELKDVNITGKNSVGGIVGRSTSSASTLSVDNCSISGEITGNSYLGGIVRTKIYWYSKYIKRM